MKSDYPDVDYRTINLDLSSEQSVRSAASEILGFGDIPEIDIAVNNAGIMNLPERTLNEKGIELTFATNHLGHFLLTCLLMPKYLQAAQKNPKGATRIINVTSASPTVAKPRWSDPNFNKINKDLPPNEQPMYQMMRNWGYENPENMSYIPLEGYNQSKVANVLFSIGLNQRLYEQHGILSYAVHPGIIATELSRTTSEATMQSIKTMVESGAITFRSLGAGASTSLVAATDPAVTLPPVEADDNGKENVGIWWEDCKPSNKATVEATSNAGAHELWTRSESLVDEEFSW
jgi:NAD(P)-dependent dehydrogenase (short-subunit alcohol dehydrogenase family)